MKKTLKSISPLQFGKVAGATYAFISLIFLPFFFLVGISSVFIPHTGNTPPAAFMIIGCLVGAIFIPIFYGVMGFIFGAIAAWGYNLIAKWIGGIEVDVE